MTISAYRITKTSNSPNAFDGEGARLFGGRWNSVGVRMVYLAGSRSLATLEVLVHTEDIDTIAGAYSIIPVTFPEKLVMRVEDKDLPDDWASPAPIAATQLFGDSWIRRAHSAVLAVPSAVIHDELNYLVNPNHPDFPAIRIGTPAPFRIDPRLA